MAVGEEGYVAAGGFGAGDDAEGTLAYLFHCFAFRDAVGPEIPIGAVFADFRGGEAFVSAVVPFEEVGVGLGAIGIAGQTASFARPLQRAGEDQGKGMGTETGADRQSLLLAVGGEREVGESGVSAGKAPKGFAVADEPDMMGRHSRVTS